MSEIPSLTRIFWVLLPIACVLAVVGRVLVVRYGIPFVSRIFWTVLPILYVLVVIGWVLYLWLFDYEMGAQDFGGSLISATLLSYLIHLWLLPGDFGPEPHEGEEGEEPEE